jgi:hypothetical protein
MEKTIVVRGDPKDVHKLRAIYRLLCPDAHIEVVQKPLQGPLPPESQPRLRALDRLSTNDKDRRKGSERRAGRDRRKIIELQLHAIRRRGADRRSGTERRMARAM